MSYLDGDFIRFEPQRKAIRDRYRKQFFADLGLDPLKDPFTLDPDPAAQLGAVAGLIEKAIGLNDSDASAIEALQAGVAASALGVPSVGASPVGRPVFQNVVPMNLFKDFFSDAWGNKSDE